MTLKAKNNPLLNKLDCNNTKRPQSLSYPMHLSLLSSNHQRTSSSLVTSFPDSSTPPGYNTTPSRLNIWLSSNTSQQTKTSTIKMCDQQIKISSFAKRTSFHLKEMVIYNDVNFIFLGQIFFLSFFCIAFTEGMNIFSLEFQIVHLQSW